MAATPQLGDLSRLLAPSKTPRMSSSATSSRSSSTRTSSIKAREVTKKRPGRAKFHDGGYYYLWDKDSVSGDKTFWRCDRKGECQARIHTDPQTGQVVHRIHFHTHPPSSDAKKAKSEDQPATRKSNGVHPSSPNGSSMSGEDNDDKPVKDVVLLRSSPSSIPLPSPVLLSSTNQLLNAINGVVKAVEENSENSNADDPGISLTLTQETPAMDSTSNGSLPAFGESHLSLEAMLAAASGGEEAPADFWRLFELTRKIYSIVRKETTANAAAKGPLSYHSADVRKFVKSRRFTPYAQQLSKFSLEELHRLSLEECRLLLEDDAEGIRLFHAVKGTRTGGKHEKTPRTAAATASPSSSTLSQHTPNRGGAHDDPAAPAASTSNPSSIVRLLLAPSDTPPKDRIYQLLQLTAEHKCMSELRAALFRRDILAEDEVNSSTLCVAQKGLNIALCQETLEGWTGEMVFHYHKKKNVLILEPATTS